jgi:death-on-curing family protein
MNEIEIYQSGDNQIEIQVQFDGETVWLSQDQMVSLFQRNQSVVSRHIKNIFNDGELEEKSNMQKMHIANSDKPVIFYNLDVIISVGYRVNSKRGTQFRQWATQRLKDYLVKGYAINQKHLAKNLHHLEQAVKLIQSSGNDDSLKLNEAKGLLEILSQYTQSFILLNQYDSHSLQSQYLNDNITYEIEHEAAFAAITELKKQLIAAKEATELFGNPKDESFKGILGTIVQTFGGQYLYPTIEEQAANLLYFIIKNHPFSDGNKRIGAFIFVWFLEKNKHRFKKNGELKINDNALVALALLVAQSDPADKELMVQLIVNLISTR